MSELKIISVSVRGLGTLHKRRDVIHYLSGLNRDIILLQDTHIIAEKISSFNACWRGKAYHSCYTNNSRGTAILIDRNLQHEVVTEFVSDKGNYVILQCKIGTDTYVVGSIYGPNRDEPRFYAHLGEILDRIDYDNIIIGGDFNFVIDSVKDSYGYVRENNVNARTKFLSVCNEHSLIDIWRHYYPNKQQFTWSKSTPKQYARLDMFFVSHHVASLCSDIQINPGYRTDHDIISMTVQVSGTQRGPGLWKFNESLLTDEDYIRTVVECIDKAIEDYAVPIYTNSFLKNTTNYKDIQLQINDGLFYETLLMLIRGETVKFSKRKAKRNREKEKQLVEQVAVAHSNLSKTRSEENASRLRTCKEELEDHRKHYINGLITRSRTQWHE